MTILILIAALIFTEIATMRFSGNDFLGFITQKRKGLNFPDIRGSYMKNPKIFKQLFFKFLLFCGLEIIIISLIIIEVFIR